jgi:hypothetical protein
MEPPALRRRSFPRSRAGTSPLFISARSSKRHSLERIPIIAWVIEHEVHPRPMTMHGQQADLNTVGVEWMFVLPDGRFASDGGTLPSVVGDDHMINVMLKRQAASRRSSTPPTAWPEAPKGRLQ